MSIVTSTFTTYDAKGIREDLSDVISNISPESTPFMSAIGRGSMKQTFHEWQVDALHAVDLTNKQIEGDDIATFDAVDPTSRIGNYAQISRKTLILSDTEEIVDKAGRKSEEAYQLAKKSAELKRDMESILLANQAAAAGGTGTARATGSILAFIKTNVDKDAGGTNPVWTTAPTTARTDSGSTRAFTETQLKNVIALCWAQGAQPSIIMLGSTQKAVFSGFAGIATKYAQEKLDRQAVIIGAADIYVSDFGTLTVVPNRFMRTRDVLVLDYDYIKLLFLRKFRKVDLAKTGDASKSMLVVEYALKVENEKSQGLVADLT